MWCIQHSQGAWKEHIYTSRTGSKNNYTYTYPDNYRENLAKGESNEKKEDDKDNDEWDEHTYTDKNGQIQSYLVKKGATEEEREKAMQLAMKEQEEKEAKTTKKTSSSSKSSSKSSGSKKKSGSGSSSGSKKKSSSSGSKKSSSSSGSSSKKSSSGSSKKKSSSSGSSTSSSKKKSNSAETSSNSSSKVEYKSGADGATGLKSVKISTQDEYDTHTYVDTDGQIQEYVVKKGATEAERRYAQEQAEKERKRNIAHSALLRIKKFRGRLFPYV